MASLQMFKAANLEMFETYLNLEFARKLQKNHHLFGQRS